jgi:hypothetical protein
MPLSPEPQVRTSIPRIRPRTSKHGETPRGGSGDYSPALDRKGHLRGGRLRSFRTTPSTSVDGLPPRLLPTGSVRPVRSCFSSHFGPGAPHVVTFWPVVIKEPSHRLAPSKTYLHPTRLSGKNWSRIRSNRRSKTKSVVKLNFSQVPRTRVQNERPRPMTISSTVARFTRLPCPMRDNRQVCNIAD